jgi:hypothetical protein
MINKNIKLEQLVNLSENNLMSKNIKFKLPEIHPVGQLGYFELEKTSYDANMDDMYA